MSGNVKVVSRFRPPNSIERKEGGDEVVFAFSESDKTTVKQKNGPVSGPEAQGFTFDRVFPPNTRQEDVFEFGIKETVDDVINGYNGTIFAYGQTGSGKTYTMMGADIDDEDAKGIIPRITEQIFDSILASPANLEYLVKVSYMEIYMERIRDLLNPVNDNLQIHEDKAKGVYVKGLTDFYVGGLDEVYALMKQGGLARAVSSTNMNAESSRSHSIFVITIQQRNVETGSVKNGNLYLVDLAGSEKVGKTGASGQTLEEAKKINKSLSALGMVINALTDGKSSHIPYRDSKLTRILQESLGGNSRTTLIINCSPCAYNTDETISTLRFGVRAKSIKNSARVNAELSPAELKMLLKKARLDTERYRGFVALLEAELKRWRAGETVPESEWADMSKVIIGATGEAAAPAGPPATPSNRPMTPAIEGLRDMSLSSRPETPTAVSLDKDERDEFLRRENELSDQIAERESALRVAESSLRESLEELSFYKEAEKRLSAENKEIQSQLNDVKIELEKETYEHKEATITADILREQNQDLTVELEELRKTLTDSSRGQQPKDAAAEGKERKKAEKMAKMMAGFNAGIVSEKEEEIRSTLAKLEISDGSNLSASDLSTLKEQLLESQTLVREQQERVRHVQDENDLTVQRNEELSGRFAALQADFDKLFDQHYNKADDIGGAPSSIETEQLAELRATLEAQYAAKRDAQNDEIADLRRQLELKAREASTLQATNEGLRGSNEELKRALTVTTAAADGSRELADATREYERSRKTMIAQLTDFDSMKKNLLRDLQNRCEKVVELEMSLEESREQYNNVLRSSNSKTQQKKLAFLERNLEQLTSIQKQLVEQNATLKREVAMAERRLSARNERIEGLAQNLKESEIKLANSERKYDEQMATMRDKLRNAANLSRPGVAGVASGGAGPAFGRIAKPLRGGGPQQASVGPQTPGAGSPAPRNPALAGAQLQGQYDANSPKARSSWFFSSAK